MHLDVKADFYVLKALLLGMLEKLGYEKGRITLRENTADTVHFHPYRSAEILMDRAPVDILGEIHPAYAKRQKISSAVYLELKLDPFTSKNPTRTKAPVVSRYPSVSRDISLVVADDVKAEDVLKAAKKAGGPLVKSTEVFDVYQGEHILEGFKSLSVNIVYESKDHTLKTEDINPVHEKILSELGKKFGAALRQ